MLQNADAKGNYAVCPFSEANQVRKGTNCLCRRLACLVNFYRF